MDLTFQIHDRKRAALVGGGGVLLVILLYVCVYLPLGPGRDPTRADLAEVNRLADRKDLDKLKQAATSQDTQVAARAVQAYAQVVGSSGGSSAVPQMTQFLADPRPAVRAEAAGGWASMGPRADIHPLSRIIVTDPAPQVRTAALQSVAALKAWDALNEVLDRMADDDDPGVRRTAMRTFEETAYLRVGATYDPAAPQPNRRAAVAPFRQLVNRPQAKALYADWVKRQQQGNSEPATQ